MGCSSGGSGGGNTTTTSTQANPAVQAAYQQVLGQANNVAAQPLNQYAGPLVSGFSPDQLSAFGTIRNTQGVAQPYINQAAANMQTGAQPIQSMQFGDYDPGVLAQTGLGGLWATQNLASQIPTAIAGAQTAAQNYDVGKYLSPYTHNVTDALSNLFAENNAQQQAQIQGNAVTRGAYGGDREAVAQALTAKEQNLAQAPTLANVLQQGYQQAQNESNTQQQLALGAGQLGLGAYQTAGQLGLAAGQGALGEFNALNQANIGAQQATGWLQQGSGYGLANLGSEAQAQALAGANAQLQIGQMGQGMQQQMLNIPYEQFIQQQAYPFQTTGWLANLAEGVGSGLGGSSATTAPGPSTLGQLAGLGVAGAGIYGLGSNLGWWGSKSGGASDVGSNFGGGSDSGSNRGGRVTHREVGGAMGAPRPVTNPMGGVPDVSIDFVPDMPATAMPRGPGAGIFQPQQTTTSSGSGGGGSSALGDLGQVAGIVGTGLKIASLFGVNRGGAVPNHLAMGGSTNFIQPHAAVPMVSDLTGVQAPALGPKPSMEDMLPTAVHFPQFDQNGFPAPMTTGPRSLGSMYQPAGMDTPSSVISFPLSKGILDRSALNPALAGMGPATPVTTSPTAPDLSGSDILNQFVQPTESGGGGYRGGRITRDLGGSVPDLSVSFIPAYQPHNRAGAGLPKPPNPPQQDDSLKDISSLTQSLGSITKSLGSSSGASGEDRAAGGAVTPADYGVGFDLGGMVQQAGMTGTGGVNSLQGGVLDQYLQLPMEKLQEMALQAGPSSRAGQAIQRALQMKKMNPGMGAQAAMAPAVPSLGTPEMIGQGSAMPGSMMGGTAGATGLGQWRGGRLHREDGGPTAEADLPVAEAVVPSLADPFDPEMQGVPSKDAPVRAVESTPVAVPATLGSPPDDVTPVAAKTDLGAAPTEAPATNALNPTSGGVAPASALPPGTARNSKGEIYSTAPTGGVRPGTPGAQAAISKADAARMNAQDPEAGQHLPVMPSNFVFGDGLVAPAGAGAVNRTTASATLGQTPNAVGMVASGNVDLQRRPQVRNTDGTISTVRSMSFNDGRNEVLIPTVAADGSRILSNQEAIDQYRKSGQFLGKFDTPEHATAYAQQVHDAQAANLQAGQTPVGPVAQKIYDYADYYGVPRSLATRAAQIESGMGSNLGTRGNIFQLGKTEWDSIGGGDMRDADTQVRNGVLWLLKSRNEARSALGREPTDEEAYVVHQQGAAGGPALLNAPSGQSAIDALAPAYGGSRGKAEAAIIQNGGDLSMSAQDFTKHIAERFDTLGSKPNLGATLASAPGAPDSMAGRTRGLPGGGEIGSASVNSSPPKIEGVSQTDLADLAKQIRSVHANPSDHQTAFSNPWIPVVAAGLGMMASKNPHALGAIGEGGLTGMKVLQGQETAAQKDALTEVRAQALEQQANALLGKFAMAQDKLQSTNLNDAQRREITARGQDLVFQAREKAIAATILREQDLDQHRIKTEGLNKDKNEIAKQLADQKKAYEDQQAAMKQQQIRAQMLPQITPKQAYDPATNAWGSMVADQDKLADFLSGKSNESPYTFQSGGQFATKRDPETVFQKKQQAYLALHPNDQQGALEYANGRKGMSDEEMRKSAINIAKSQYGFRMANDTSFTKMTEDQRQAWLAQQASQHENEIRNGFGAPASTTTRSATPAASQANQAATPAKPAVAPNFDAVGEGDVVKAGADASGQDVLYKKIGGKAVRVKPTPNGDYVPYSP